MKKYLLLAALVGLAGCSKQVAPVQPQVKPPCIPSISAEMGRHPATIVDRSQTEHNFTAECGPNEDTVNPSIRVIDAYKEQAKNKDFNTAWNHTVYCIPDGLKP